MVLSALFMVLLVQLSILCHEGAHALAAKLCGIPLRRARVGLGPVIARWQTNGLTCEYALIPLGGFVECEPASFKSATFWSRQLIWLAGPFSHIVTAALFITAATLIKVPYLPTVIEKLSPTPYSQAVISTPTQITHVDYEPVTSWPDFAKSMIIHLGKQVTISTEQGDYLFNLESWRLGRESPLIMEELGITPYVPPQTVWLFDQASGSTDTVTHINGQPIRHGYDIQQAIKGQLGHNVRITTTTSEKQVPVGYQFGQSWRIEPRLETTLKTSPIKPHYYPDSWHLGIVIKQLMHDLSFQWHLIKGIALGHIDWQVLTGPLGFFAGLTRLAQDNALPQICLGLASINLWFFFFNLLPCPPLDGGRAICEFFRIDDSLQGLFNHLGLIALITTVVALSIHEIFFLLAQTVKAEQLIHQAQLFSPNLT